MRGESVQVDPPFFMTEVRLTCSRAVQKLPASKRDESFSGLISITGDTNESNHRMPFCCVRENREATTISIPTSPHGLISMGDHLYRFRYFEISFQTCLALNRNVRQETI